MEWTFEIYEADNTVIITDPSGKTNIRFADMFNCPENTLFFQQSANRGSEYAKCWLRAKQELISRGIL